MLSYKYNCLYELVTLKHSLSSLNLRTKFNVKIPFDAAVVQ